MGVVGNEAGQNRIGVIKNLDYPYEIPEAMKTTLQDYKQWNRMFRSEIQKGGPEGCMKNER